MATVLEFIGSGIVSYYVDGENGDDSYDGTSPTNGGGKGTVGPWKSIPFALSQIEDSGIFTPNDGDEIIIMKTSDDSTYYAITGSLDVSWSSKEVSIVGADSSGNVDGTVVEINGGSLNSTTPMMIISGSSNDSCSFANIKFNADGTAQYCIEATGANNHHISWINCRFTDAISHGVYTNSNANYWNFINCRFDNNAGNGLDHYGSQYGLVYKCLMDENTGIGYKCGAVSRVTECVIYNNGGIGLSINGMNCIVCNNIIDFNGGVGIKVWGSSTSRFIDNVITNNSGMGLDVDNANAESVHFNSNFDNNSSVHNSQNHTRLYDYHTGSISYADASNHDFTPTSTSDVIGNGFPTHYKWFGTTGGDTGIGKYVKEDGENISIF
jgi:hypothetical protein